MEMARIGVVSDTHGTLPREAFELFAGQWSNVELNERVAWRFAISYDTSRLASLEEISTCAAEPLTSRPCDLILHAGDIGVQSVLDELGAIARTIAVLGNNDRVPFWCSDGDVRPFRSLTFGGVRIALQHIPTDLDRSLHGKPPLIEPSMPTLPDLAIHGHTHVPRIELDDDCILLCPGSPTQARRGSGHRVALVDLENDHLSEAIFFDLDR